MLHFKLKPCKEVERKTYIESNTWIECTGKKIMSPDSAAVPFSICLTMDSNGTNSDFASMCVALNFLCFYDNFVWFTKWLML